MIVATRHRVRVGAGQEFLAAAQAALDVLAGRPGFLDGHVGRAVDEADLWLVVSRWRDVGSYRRALTGVEAKTLVVPLLSTALDEPSAFEVLAGSGTAVARSALAADAATTRLGTAASPVVPTDLD